MKDSQGAADTSEVRSNNSKRLIAVVSSGVGIGCAAAIAMWPNYKVPLQMVFYTFLV